MTSAITHASLGSREFTSVLVSQNENSGLCQGAHLLPKEVGITVSSSSSSSCPMALGSRAGLKPKPPAPAPRPRPLPFCDGPAFIPRPLAECSASISWLLALHRDGKDDHRDPGSDRYLRAGIAPTQSPEFIVRFNGRDESLRCSTADAVSDLTDGFERHQRADVCWLHVELLGFARKLVGGRLS